VKTKVGGVKIFMMKKKIVLAVLSLAFTFSLLAPKVALADALGNPNCKDTEIYTAIGCVPVLNNDNGASLIAFILRWAVGIGGGIAFLLILYGGFMVMSSAGNPERLKAGQELLTSAISGLILLIFSVFILKFIGLDILGLGAFGFGK